MAEITTEKPLSSDIITNSISLIAATPNSLSHAFVRLEAENKEITNIDSLIDFPHLRYINLSSNKISSLSPGLTVQNFCLSLNISNNKLTSIQSDVFTKKKYLQQVNFSGNEIEKSEVGVWMNVRWMNLNKNKLTEILLNDAPELTHLEARSNQLLSTKGINAPKLRTLYLAGNPISKLEGINTLGHLERLHLRDTQLENLDGFSETMKSLVYLNLRNTKISNFSDLNKLACLKGLKELSLRDTPLSSLENYRLQTILRIPQLQKLDKDPILNEEREDAASLKVELENEEAEKAAEIGESKSDNDIDKDRESEQSARLDKIEN